MKLFKDNRVLLALTVAVIFSVYYFLHLKYWIYYVDDSWTLTYVYAHIFYGLDMDLVFRPETSDRVFLYFGKTYHFLYGNIFNLIGWTKSNALLISTIFIFVDSILWYVIAGVLGFSRSLRIVSAMSILVFPAFFSAANMARPDTMTLFFILLTFLMFIKRRYFLSGLFMMIGFENHIMGAVSAFYLIAYCVYNRKEFLSDKNKLLKEILFFGLGAIAGLFYYGLMHYKNFSYDKVFGIISDNRTMDFPINNYILTYFFSGDFHRHLIEFIFVFVTIVIYFKKKLYRENKLVLILAATMVISTFITKRPNHNYMLFIYPGILLLVFYTYEKLGILKKTALYVFGYFLIQYGLIYAFAFGFDFEKVNAHTRSYLTDSEAVVVGMPDNWFAAMDRTFYPIYPHAKDFKKKEFKKAYLIKNDYISKKSRNYEDVIKYFENNFEMKKIAHFEAYQNKFVEIYECIRK